MKQGNYFILLFCLLPTSTGTVQYSTGQSPASWFWINLKKSGEVLRNQGVHHLPQQLKVRTVKHHDLKENKIKPLLEEGWWEQNTQQICWF